MHIIVTARILHAQLRKSTQVSSEEMLEQKLRTCIEITDKIQILNPMMNLKLNEVYKYLEIDLNLIFKINLLSFFVIEIVKQWSFFI